MAGPWLCETCPLAEKSHLHWGEQSTLISRVSSKSWTVARGLAKTQIPGLQPSAATTPASAPKCVLLMSGQDDLDAGDPWSLSGTTMGGHQNPPEGLSPPVFALILLGQSQV